MASEEQYLDELLKSMTEGPVRARTMREVMQDMMGVDIGPSEAELADSANEEPQTSFDVANDTVANIDTDVNDINLADMLDNVVGDVDSSPVGGRLVDIETEEPTEPSVETFTFDEPIMEAPVLEEVVAPVVEEPVVEEPVIEEVAASVVEEPVETPVAAPAAPEGKMSQDDIAALLASMEAESAPVEEPVVEEQAIELPIEEVAAPVVEEPIETPVAAPTAPEGKMSQDDIAALLASMEAESAPVEESVVEEPAIELPIEEVAAPVAEEPVGTPAAAPAAPEGKMSQDDIAALLASMEAESAPIEEPVVEEPVIEEVAAPVAEEPVETPAAAPAAPEGKMSQDDIAALLASMEAEGAPIEEPVVEEPSIELPIEEVAAPIAEEPVEEPAAAPAAPEGKMSQDDIAALLASMEAEGMPVDEPVADEPATDDIAIDEPAADDIIIDEPSNISDDIIFEEEPTGEDLTGSDEAGELSQDDLSALLSGLEEGDAAPEGSADNGFSDNEEFSQEDLAALLAGLEDTPSTNDTSSTSSEGDQEGGSAQDALSMLENLGDSDEDLLSLLEGIDENAGSDGLDESSEAEINDLLGSDEKKETKKEKKERLKKEKQAKKEQAKKEKAEKAEKGEDKKAKKGFSLFGKKKAEPEEETENADNIDTSSEKPSEDQNEVDDLLSGLEGFEFEAVDENGNPIEDIGELGLRDKSEEKKKEKKPGFLAKLLAFLTEEIDEEPEEEKSNEDILAEVDAEALEESKAKGKKKKDKKAKKKDKKASGGEGADGEGEGAPEEGKKGKKPKKEKKPKEPKEDKPKEPRKKILSTKATVGLVAFAATLVAAVVIVSTILPEHSDLKEARKAYFEQDYKTTYENMYGKKLKSSDEILFRRSETILLLNRRWESYKNRMALGQEPKALDSLIEGVNLYYTLVQGDGAEVIEELNSILTLMTDTLDRVYGVSLQEAIDMNSLDKNEYTDRIYTIIYGDSWKIKEPDIADSFPIEEETGAADENFDEVILEDMLPEEGDF